MADPALADSTVAGPNPGNSALDFVQVIHDRLTLKPEARAFEIDSVWHSWGEVHDIVQRIDALLEKVGISAHSPVGLIGRNRLTAMSAMLGILHYRRTIICIHSLLPEESLAAEIERLQLPVIIADQRDWANPKMVEAARQAGTIGVALSDEGTKIELVAGLERMGAGPYRPETPDIAVEILTSGTTGFPKRVPVAWKTVNLSMADAKKVLVQNFEKTARLDSASPIRVHYVPLGNMSGVWTLFATVLDGYPMVVYDKFNVDRWVETMRLYRPHYVGLVPAAVKMVYDANVPVDVLSSVTVLNMGGAKLDPIIQRDFETKYDITILTGYGATEFFGTVAAWTIEDRKKWGESKLGSVGMVRPGINMRIVHPETFEPVATGETGLLEVQVERTGAGWTRTTDLGSFDQDGFLFIHGRADGAISRGGFKMHPYEIVEVLCRHPSVADAAAVGIPDARLGEVPVAAVELVPGAAPLDPAELEAFARQHLLRYKVPVRFIIVDKLPRTLSMKVSMPEVRALFAS